MSQSTPFEPSVQFSADPYEAACVFLAVMAYPGLAAGDEGNARSAFAAALRDYMLWMNRKHRTLARIRAIANNPRYVAPTWRSFEGPLNHGLKRVDQRLTAYDLYGTQILRGFFAVRELGRQALQEGRADEAFQVSPTGSPSPAREVLWKKGTPSARKIMAGAIDYWSKRFGLNTTNRPADVQQKAKDLQRRALHPSEPVLHMAHALSEAAHDAGPRIAGWDRRDPLLALLMNAELWIWDAIAVAEQWRTLPHFASGRALTPEDMIVLIAPESNSTAKASA